MVSMIMFYWPKLVAGAWFAISNFLVARKNDNKGRFPAPLQLLILFLCSSGVMALVAEIIAMYFYSYVIVGMWNAGMAPLPYVILQIFIDGLCIFIGGNIYSFISKLKKFKGAALYMQFVCIERLSIIIAVGQWDLLAVMVVLQAIVIACEWKYMALLESTDRYNWRRMFTYLTALFYVLDVLYGAFFIFSELKTNVVEITNMVWLDSVALLTSIFVLGYIQVSLRETQQENSKFHYLEKLQHSQEDIIVALTEIMEAKSGETGQHIRRVAEYSRCLAGRLLHDEEEVEMIRVASMMQDIGKLMVSFDILTKPARLNAKEYEEVKEHAKYGWELLSRSDDPLIKMARVIAYQHHEHWDGNGYPEGLKGNEISIYAQIVSVADVYDALTSERSYKSAWPPEEAAAEIIQQRGKQFAPAVVEAFIHCYDDIEVIRAEYQDDPEVIQKEER